ncbi:ParB/RepB/Spo0J family partition protein [Arthrobacter sp. TMN-50]
MAEKRRGLGRGLGALIPSAPVETPDEVRDTATPRNGRPADLFFPAAPERSVSEYGATVEPPRSARGASGINKDALKAPTRAPKRIVQKKSGSDPVVSSEPDGKLGSVPTAEGQSNSTQSGSRVPTAPEVADLSRIEPGVTGTESQDLGGVSRETAHSGAESHLVAVPGATFAEIPVGLIHANRKQPRSVFDDDEMAELVNSIREIGVLQPIVVRPSAEGGDQPYELVMGERRWRASREAGLAAVPAIIRSTADDDLLRDALLENLHRSQLNPLEEAAAYQQLLDDFGCSHDELAERIGRSRPQISNTLRLMKLPPLVQRRLAAGIITAGHARALLGLNDQVEMEKLAQKIVAEGLSVRTTEELVSMNDGLRRPVKPNSPRAGARHERLDYLASSLSDRLDTSVKITLGARKGKVSIEFASVDDLNRIMGVLGSSPSA